MSSKKKYKVKLRLDGILVELEGVTGSRPGEYGGRQDKGLVGAIENAKALCIMSLTKEFKGMKLEHLEGRHRVVGVEVEDAWPSDG